MDARSNDTLLLDEEIIYSFSYGAERISHGDDSDTWYNPGPICSIMFSHCLMRNVAALSSTLSSAFEVYVERECTPELTCAVSGRPSFPRPDSEGCFGLVENWM